MHARVLQSPFTLPMRVLELGGSPSIAGVIDTLVSGSRDRSAVVTAAAPPSDAEETVRSGKWANVDVLHLDELAADGDLLRTSAAEVPGALGWILRRTAAWKTRLVVIEARADRMPIVRRLGHAIVDRSGPAVILIGGDAPQARMDLYAGLLHDRPFDWIQQNADGLTVFGGGGREETLRVSTMAALLASAASTERILQMIRKSTPRPYRTTPARMRVRTDIGDRKIVITSIKRSIGEAARQLRLDVKGKSVGLGWQYVPKRIRFGEAVAARMFTRGYIVRPLDLEMTSFGWSNEYITIDTLADQVYGKTLTIDDVLSASTTPRLDEIVAERLTNLEVSVKELEFEDEEGKGTLPVAIKTLNLRDLYMLGTTGERERERQAEPRQVKARFYRSFDTGALDAVPQRGSFLSPGEPVHLGIAIGSADPSLITIGPVTLDESAFKWEPGQQGCWIAIGVTPLDFDLAGAPVQEVWLPRRGDAQLVTFAVTPSITTALAGVARLRFTLYFRENIVQSFLVAARVAPAAADTAQNMATALGVEASEMSDAQISYVSRLEYSAADLSRAGTVPPRALSIVANESAGQKVFTVKGQEVFSSSINAQATALVDQARIALKDASYSQKRDEYRYRTDNSAAAEDLLSLLWDVAKTGWRLYAQIVPDGSLRESIAKNLGTEGIIHAAHVDLNQVVPWSLIYDLPIDDGLDTRSVMVDGVKTIYNVRHAVCPAGLPRADRSIAQEACGTTADCVLHGADADGCRVIGDEMFCRETVICPRHFWGFAHQIEVPAQQAIKGGAPPDPSTAIAASCPAAIAVGYNPNFETAKTHLDALRALANAHLEEPDPVDRNEILQLLKRIEPDLVYFYCHAWLDEEKKPGIYSPNLDFGCRAPSDIVSFADLQGRAWARHPLVFLNGCSTLGFTAAAPSSFITSLVQNRKASAVIGTEVTVWERLATEMALLFFEAFLDTSGSKPPTAGTALTDARRRLLLKNNPLGLVYTLYGSADVHLEFKERVQSSESRSG